MSDTSSIQFCRVFCRVAESLIWNTNTEAHETELRTPENARDTELLYHHRILDSSALDEENSFCDDWEASPAQALFCCYHRESLETNTNCMIIQTEKPIFLMRLRDKFLSFFRFDWQLEQEYTVLNVSHAVYRDPAGGFPMRTK